MSNMSCDIARHPGLCLCSANVVFLLYLAACSLNSMHPIGEIICQSYGLLLQKVEEGRPTWTQDGIMIRNVSGKVNSVIIGEKLAKIIDQASKDGRAEKRAAGEKLDNREYSHSTYLILSQI